MTVKEAIQAFVDEYNAAKVNGKLELAELLLLSAYGANIYYLMVKAIADVDEGAFQLFVSDVEEFIQDVVVPLELTKYGVPAFVENFLVDPQLRPAVRPIMESIRAKLQAA